MREERRTFVFLSLWTLCMRCTLKYLLFFFINYLQDGAYMMSLYEAHVDSK